ncbi:MAG: FkbM family methyltransferase [Proteobacteria bacterium]|nr:MAG: FkbM family methyltransferase [Pseudomonadota bacterium]
MLMAELTGKDGRVYALEANPILSKLILKSSRVNGFERKINIINKAISDQSGAELDFVYSDESPMNGLLAENISTQARKNHYPKSQKVDVSSIDDLFINEASIDFIKIDIEGSEDKFSVRQSIHKK